MGSGRQVLHHSFLLVRLHKGAIQGYPLQGFRWFDIGKPETLAQAEEYYKQK